MPIAGVDIPTFSPEVTKRTAMEAVSETLPMAGSIAATAFAPQVGIPARMLLSGGGATLGTAGKQLIETFGLNKPVDAAKMALEYPEEFFKGAVAEGAGQVIGKGFSKGAALLRESALGTKLLGPVISKEAEIAAKQEVQGMLKRYGTTLGIQEASEGVLPKVVERISRIGPTKAASEADRAMTDAISKEVSSLADEITSTVLSRENIGTGLMTAQKQGRSTLYKNYGETLGELMDDGGSLAVSMSSVNNIGTAALGGAKEKLVQGAAASNIMGTAAETEAKSLLALKPELTFKQANEVRSSLLEKQREMEKGTPAYNIVSKAVEEISKAMDNAAGNASPELLARYKALTSGYKQAIAQLDPKILANAANKYPEKIADNLISNGTTSAWKETQIMLNKAKSLGVDTTGLAENIQRAYLEKTFADSGITQVASKLKDKAKAEQFAAILPKDVQNRARAVAKAGEILGQRGKAIDLASAAALSTGVGTAAGAFIGDSKEGAGIGAAGGIVTLVLAPKLAARVAYSSVLTNKLLQSAALADKGNFAASSLKLAEIYRELSKEGGGTPQGLSPQEKQEMEALRQEVGQ
jgi:hypothetical protein